MSDRDARVSKVYLVEAKGLTNPPLNGFKKGAFIAAGEVKGGDADGDVAAWIVDKEMTELGGGAVLAIDAMAKSISHFGADIGEGSPPAMYMEAATNLPAYDTAVDCAS